ncbi:MULTISPECIES: Cmx/CmrA family chloramphenicol efflux MFS transporter [unclassified Micromonospora]|uniref:Cmx/CmrA family chloramphenicol efflux MFS transporter n=1 Tax=unclassified Micromonospora TaxID=2617518 RepID=UPI00098D2A1C|nr:MULTISPECIES: Cmx/CmrA family chloramphenicol efflux MFS transporter [unclassified Micromonospora]OON27600.1 chloramphenicol efflux pump [Micromonospora sp. Rc5]
MPIVIYILGLAVFAQGTSEFMLAGLIPDIAADLRVSVPAAGTLTSTFAAGMIIGAPLMAVLSLRWPRRWALLVFLTAFIAAHVVGAVTGSFGVLLATRVVGAVANAGFLAVGLATAVGLAGPHAKGRAASVLLGGVTLACVAGVPAGAVLGNLWGWRTAFWAVAAVSVPAAVAILRSVPPTPPGAPLPDARRELRALRRPRLAVTLALAALVNGATFCTFTYLAPLATEVSGYGRAWVPALLAVFGLGSFVGVTVAGRLSDTRPMRILVPGGLALLAGWLLFAATAAIAPVALLLVLVQGALSFAVGATLITLVLYRADDAPSLGGSFATAALNVGATVGPLLGGAAIGAGLGYRSPLWVSALLVALALTVGLVPAARSRARTSPPGQPIPS